MGLVHAGWISGTRGRVCVWFVQAPKFQQAPVEPLTRDDVEALIAACDFTQRADIAYRRRFRMRRPTAMRDRAIILMLLDTGLRASELCRLRVWDVDLKTGRVEILHGPMGAGERRQRANCVPGPNGQALRLEAPRRESGWRRSQGAALHRPRGEAADKGFTAAVEQIYRGSSSGRQLLPTPFPTHVRHHLLEVWRRRLHVAGHSWS